MLVDGRLVTWADVEAMQSLQDGYLPIPSVDWRHRRLLACASPRSRHGEASRSQLVARYRLANTGKVRARLCAGAGSAAVPGQSAEPVPQHHRRRQPDRVAGCRRWHGVGGRRAARVRQADPGRVVRERVRCRHGSVAPRGGEAAGCHEGAGRAPGWPPARCVYRMRLSPGQTRDDRGDGADDRRSPRRRRRWWRRRGAAAARSLRRWRDKLDRVHIDVPPQGQALVDTLRTVARAHADLAHRPAPAAGHAFLLRASWIRDGAMISEGLLRMGREDVVRDYVAWYAPYPVQGRHGAVLRRRPRQRPGAGERQPWRADLQHRRTLSLHRRPGVPGEDVAARAGRVRLHGKTARRASAPRPTARSIRRSTG